MSAAAVGPLVQSFFLDGLLTMKGLRLGSVRSYRDAMRLWLTFVAADTGRRITRLTLEDLSFERVLRFHQHLETAPHDHIRTRNQRLAMLHTFFLFMQDSIRRGNLSPLGAAEPYYRVGATRVIALRDALKSLGSAGSPVSGPDSRMPRPGVRGTTRSPG